MTKIIIKPILLSLTNKRKITVHKNNYYSKKLTILQLLIHISLPKLRIFSWVSSCALHGHCAGKRAKKKKKKRNIWQLMRRLALAFPTWSAEVRLVSGC